MQRPSAHFRYAVRQLIRILRGGNPALQGGEEPRLRLAETPPHGLQGEYLPDYTV
jgi:hypothetical protein